MLKKISITIAGTIFAFCAGGCATIVHGTQQSVFIKTNPPGANISVDGQQLRAPAMVKLSGKSSGYVVRATKKGYKPTTAKIGTSFRAVPTILGNILWLLPGVIVDCISGSAFELDHQVVINLRK